jgi:hypothetical protein
MAGRKFDDTIRPAVEERVGPDEESSDPLSRERSEYRFDLAFARGSD